MRLNLSAIVLEADAFCLDEKFDDGYLWTDIYNGVDAAITELQPDAYFEDEWSFELIDTFSDEVIDDSFGTTDFPAGEDFYYVDALTDPFADAAYYEWYHLSSEYTDDLAWYTYDTTIVDDSSGGLDDIWYFADVADFTDTDTDDWFELYSQDSSGLLTSNSDINVEESNATESIVSAENRVTVDSSTVVVDGVHSGQVVASKFAMAVTHPRSAAELIYFEGEIVDAGARWQNTGRRIPGAGESLLAGHSHPTPDLFSSTESFQDRDRIHRRSARSNVESAGSMVDRSELIGRLDQLFREFSHAHGVAADFDQFELSVTYPGPRVARLLQLSAVSSGNAQCSADSAGIFGVNLLQDPPERLDSHEAVGAIVAAGLVGAAARSGWMLRRRREYDMQVAETGPQNS